MLSMHNDRSVISRMMEISANSYLTKESGSEMILRSHPRRLRAGFLFRGLTNKALLSGLRTKRTIRNPPYLGMYS